METIMDYCRFEFKNIEDSNFVFLKRIFAIIGNEIWDNLDGEEAVLEQFVKKYPKDQFIIKQFFKDRQSFTMSDSEHRPILDYDKSLEGKTII